MLREPTTLVLGAGASFDFGFPLGTTLKTDIFDAVSSHISGRATADNHILIQQYAKRLFVNNDNEFLECIDKLARSICGYRSIDECLSAYSSEQKRMKIGKFAIAHIIASYERQLDGNAFIYDNDSIQISHNFENSWVLILVQLLFEGLKQHSFDDVFKNLTLVNFNYDRSVYIMLYYALTTIYGMNEYFAKIALRDLRAFHPYGSLGKMDFGDGKGTSWGLQNCKMKSVSAVAESLKVYTEERTSEDPSIVEMREALRKSKKIVFLGFGFHKQNMNLLSVKRERLEEDIYENQEVFSTLMSEKKSRRQYIDHQISEAFATDTTPQSISYFPGSEKQDCRMYLEEHYNLIQG